MSNCSETDSMEFSQHYWCNTSRRISSKCCIDWTIDYFSIFSTKFQDRLASNSFREEDSGTEWYLQLRHEFVKGTEIGTGKVTLYIKLRTELKESIEALVEVYIYNCKGEKELKFTSDPYEFFGSNKDICIKNFLDKSMFSQNSKQNNSLKLYCEINVLSEPITKSGLSSRPVIPECDLSVDFGIFLRNEKFCDIVLDVDGKEFPAHKAILAAHSPVFFAMLDHEMSEKQQSRVVIKDIKPAVFHGLLEYIYTGKVSNLQNMAQDLLLVAENYAMMRLKVICEEELSLNLSEESILRTLIFADIHSAEVLKSNALTFLVTHRLNVIDSPEWKKLETEFAHLTKDVLYSLINEPSVIKMLKSLNTDK